jgi:spermidine synthase
MRKIDLQVEIPTVHELIEKAIYLSKLFEELDYRPTPMGALSLRRRRNLAEDRDVFEIKLGEEFLMSSEFTDAEVALADIGIGAARGSDLDVVVGGLGLGYTARAALKHSAVKSVIVIDALAEVIEWHETGLAPLGPELTKDERCRLIHGDFFVLAADPQMGFDVASPGRRFDCILLDIDHAPDNWLSPAHKAFYQPEGIRNLAMHLRPSGVFALWSNDPPDDEFVARLSGAFGSVEARVIEFDGLNLDRMSANTVYVARV